MATAIELLNKMNTELANFHGTTLVKLAGEFSNNSEFYKAIYHLGQMINGYKSEIAAVQQQATQQQATQQQAVQQALQPTAHFIRQQIVKVANEIDAFGDPELADKLDDLLQRSNDNLQSVNDLIDMANVLDQEGNYQVANVLDSVTTVVKNADKEEMVLMPHEGTLSTRYCPDHHGTQTIRIDDHVCQCPIDGKKYDYERGYKNYHGQIVPGGSVAAQTPTSADYGGIPMRYYDSRQSVLNHIN